MARTANPNKEKIAAVKSEIKEHNKVVRAGETAAKKLVKFNERLAKLTGVEVPAAKTAKPTKADKVKKASKVDVAAEKKKAAKVVTKKKGRPAKKTEDDED